MASRYQHLSPAFLSDAVKMLDSVFGEAVGLQVTEAQQESPTIAKNRNARMNTTTMHPLLISVE